MFVDGWRSREGLLFLSCTVERPGRGGNPTHISQALEMLPRPQAPRAHHAQAQSLTMTECLLCGFSIIGFLTCFPEVPDGALPAPLDSVNQSEVTATLVRLAQLWSISSHLVGRTTIPSLIIQPLLSFSSTSAFLSPLCQPFSSFACTILRSVALIPRPTKPKQDASYFRAGRQCLGPSSLCLSHPSRSLLIRSTSKDRLVSSSAL